VEPVGEPEHGVGVVECDNGRNDLSPICSTGLAAGVVLGPCANLADVWDMMPDALALA
jgi:hypothetical protein